MKQKSLSATLWTLASFGGTQFLRLFSNLILTRLLLPEMFGLMAIVTVVRVGVYMCSEIGLKVNIIRHEQGEDPEVLNTAWTMQTIRGVFLWVIIALISWGLSALVQHGFIPENSVYADERLPMLLFVTGAAAFISGFESTKIWLAQRNMMLARLTLLDLFAQVSGLLLMVGLAWQYQTVWALVAGGLVGAFIKTSLSHFVLVGEKNYFCLNKQRVIEFLHFGKWLFLSAVITFIAANGDRLILGGLLTAEQLGFYAIAYFLATALRDLVEKMIANVWFPLLSKANRDDKSTVADVYYAIRQKLDLGLYFFIGVIYVISPVIIQLLYDDRYLSATWMLQILTVSLLPLGVRLGSSLLLVRGNPKIGTLTVVIRAIFLFLMIPWGYHNYGLEGAVWSIALNPLFEIPVVLWFFSKYRMIAWLKEIKYTPMLILGYYFGQMMLSLFVELELIL